VSAIKKLSEFEGLDIQQIFNPSAGKLSVPDFWIANVSHMDSPSLLQLCKERSVLHVVDSESEYFEKEKLASAIMMFDAKAFREYPLSSILTPNRSSAESEKNLCLVKTSFNAALDKPRLLSELAHAIEPVVKSSSLRSDAATIADELIANAIYNAPYVSKDNLRSGISRIQSHITMGIGMFGEFFVGTDGDRLVIGVSDPFGSLNVNALLDRIRNCYVNSVAATMNMDANGGAGIGSYMVFNSSSSLFVLVDEDKLTLVCSVIRLKGSSRSRSEAQKNLHCRHIKKE
jgi:hypothetical protein